MEWIGFINEALIDCHETVNKASAIALSPAPTMIQVDGSMRNAKLLSHLFIRYQASGIATRLEIRIK